LSERRLAVHSESPKVSISDETSPVRVSDGDVAAMTGHDRYHPAAMGNGSKAFRFTLVVALALLAAGAALFLQQSTEKREPIVAPEVAAPAIAPASPASDPPEIVIPSDASEPQRESVAAPSAGLHRVSVLVCDEDGVPLPGIGLSAHAIIKGWGPGTPTVEPAFFVSDDHGRATCEYRAGPMYVQANADQRQRRPSPPYDPRFDTGFAGEFDLGPAGIDAEITLLARTSGLDVRVVDDRGVGVEGIEVELSQTRSTVATDGAGYARFEALPARRMSLRFRGERLDRTNGDHDPASGHPAAHVVLPRAARAGFEFVLTRRGSVEVRFDGVDAEAPPKVRLRIRRERNDGESPREREVSSAADVTIPHVQPGRFSLQTQVHPTSIHYFEPPAPFDVIPGETSTVLLVAARGRAILGGRIVDWLGRPCAGIRITVGPDVAGSVRHDWSKETTSGGDGAFRILGLPEVPVWLWIGVEDRKGDPVALFTGDRRLPTPRDGLLLELARGYRIAVEVVAAKTGERVVEPIDVRIDDGTWKRTETTGFARGPRPRVDGFVAVENLHAGTYRLVCVGSDRKPIGPEVEVVCRGDATDVSVVLRADVP
jgi:hypothetical protein